MNDDELLKAVRHPRPLAPLQDAVYGVYQRVQALVDQHKPRCVASGECCRFDAYGHRLYVTTLELIVFTNQLAIHPAPAPALLPVLASGACQFQMDGLCGAHTIRPFGCRMFYCDPTTTAWQQDAYEAFHAELKALHERFDVPYFYVEWRDALRRVLPECRARSVLAR